MYDSNKLTILLNVFFLLQIEKDDKIISLRYRDNVCGLLARLVRHHVCCQKNSSEIDRGLRISVRAIMITSMALVFEEFFIL